MIAEVPQPISGGLILSYKCPAECRHCIYACSPWWDADWISEPDLEAILGRLSGYIQPATYGPQSIGLNEGLHFTGGEPFANFPLLLRAVEISEELRIPSTFVETNGYWCSDDKKTLEKLRMLKSSGLKGILISVNPFYLEYVPFERTERAIRLSLEVFGQNTIVYQAEYYHRFRRWNLRGRVPFRKYLTLEGPEDFARHAEFFVMGRAPYRLKDLLLEASYPLLGAHSLVREGCMMPFLRSLHNHFDNYGNYVPGFCAGITFGDCRNLDDLLREGVDIERYPVLGFLMKEDLESLLRFAQERGYEESQEGYFSRCHLCMDIRKDLALTADYPELQPKQFYRHLIGAGPGQH
jgi:hypothetical protein